MNRKKKLQVIPMPKACPKLVKNPGCNYAIKKKRQYINTRLLSYERHVILPYHIR